MRNAGTDLNSVLLTGQLTRDPKFMNVGKNQDTSLFMANLCVETRSKAFIPIKAWREVADDMAATLRQGDRIKIEGSLGTGSYDKPDGTKVYTWEVTVSKWSLVDTPAAAPARGAERAARTAPEARTVEPDRDDNIPF